MLQGCKPKLDLRQAESPPVPEKNSPMVEALVQEISTVIAEPVNSEGLQEIILLCQSAQQVLFIREPRSRLGKKKRGMMQAGYGGGMPMPYVGGGIYSNPGSYDDEPMSNGALDRETFGAKIMRELVNLIPHITRINREDPVKIIEAIAAAKEHGMPELAAQLEERLTNPKPPEVDVTPAGVPNSTAPQPQPQEA